MSSFLRLLRGHLLLMVTVLAGCSDDPTSPPTRVPGSGPPVIGSTAAPTFSSDVQEVFERRGCTASSCHGAGAVFDLDLRRGNAYGHLVRIRAFGDTTRIRVIPGDAENSYLIVKLENRQTAGRQMPLGGAPLSTTDLKTIRRWIQDGAVNN